MSNSPALDSPALVSRSLASATQQLRRARVRATRAMADRERGGEMSLLRGLGVGWRRAGAGRLAVSVLLSLGVFGCASPPPSEPLPPPLPQYRVEVPVLALSYVVLLTPEDLVAERVQSAEGLAATTKAVLAEVSAFDREKPGVLGDRVHVWIAARSRGRMQLWITTETGASVGGVEPLLERARGIRAPGIHGQIALMGALSRHPPEQRGREPREPSVDKLALPEAWRRAAPESGAGLDRVLDAVWPAEQGTECASARCGGRAGEHLEAELRRSALSARGCYNTQLRKAPGLTGGMTVQLRIGGDGVPCSVRVTGDTTGNADLARCVADRMRDETYEHPVGGCVNVDVPMLFKLPPSGAPNEKK